MAQPRQWRISVDGACICFGTVAEQPGAPAGAPPSSDAAAPSARFVVASWRAAPELRLRDPATALNDEALCMLFGFLGVRDRLRCASVCRAWRAALQPPPAAAPRHVSAWARVDLSAAAFPRSAGAKAALPLRALLERHLLPWAGSHIRELSLRDTDADDDVLRLVVARCPQLCQLDVRGCRMALRCSGAADEKESFLQELLDDVYARGRPGDRFSLLLQDSGFHTCTSCDEPCDASLAYVVYVLEPVLAWPVKAPPRSVLSSPPPRHQRQQRAQRQQPAADGARLTWLSCDVMLCPLRHSVFDFTECEKLLFAPQNGPPQSGDGAARECSSCGSLVCDGCAVLRCCSASYSDDFMCATCYAEVEMECSLCDDVVCTSCCSQRCMRAEHGCKVCVCIGCLDAHPHFFTRCGGCGAAACPAHTAVCETCTGLDVRALVDLRRLGCEPAWTDFRAIMQCCHCQRISCCDCDPGPSDGAGVTLPELMYQQDGQWCNEDDDRCTYCCSWPKTCGGLTAAELESQQYGAEGELEDADAAAAEAAEATEAADAARAAAAAAAVAAAAAAQVEADAKRAAERSAERAAFLSKELVRIHAAIQEAKRR